MSSALLVGDRHGGKTTTCLRLAERARRRGVTVAGIVSRATFEANCCVGYEVIDLRTGHQARLARLDRPGVEQAGRFGFLAAGLEFGRVALEDALTRSARLIIVDEVGRLELDGGGWATQLDRLADYDGLTLLALRRKHVEQVTRRWCLGPPPQRRPGPSLLCDLDHGADAAIDAIMRLVVGTGNHGGPRAS